MNTFLNLTVYGLSDGAILALAALGFVLIYKATGVINFAQGEFLLIGAYTLYTTFVVFQLPMVLAVMVGVVFAKSLDADDTGYALTMEEARPVLVAGRTADDPVDVGGCAAG